MFVFVWVPFVDNSQSVITKGHKFSCLDCVVLCIVKMYTMCAVMLLLEYIL